MIDQPITLNAKADFKNIMLNISRMQNGEISRLLSKMGVIYRENYGVSIPHLRQIVSCYKPNNELAFDLWNKDIRETKILSSILFEPDKITFHQAIEIAKKIDNQELVEQFSRNCFSKLPFLLNLAEHWLNGTDWEKIVASYSLGWQIRQQNKSDYAAIKLTYNFIEELNSLENNPLHPSLLFLLQSIAKNSASTHTEIKEKATLYMQSGNYSIRRLGEEFLWLDIN
jgi:3-methyladenine DNA glycosylase AlkD